MNELAKSIAELIGTINKGANGAGEAIQKIAPDAWDIAVRQVIVDAWSGIAAAACFCLILVAIAIKCRANEKWNLHEAELAKKREATNRAEVFAGNVNTWATGRWVALIVATIVMTSTVCAYADNVLNPEYEAASQLSERFLGK